MKKYQSANRITAWALAAGAMLMLIAALPAQAATYNYWSLWTASNDKWSPSQVGMNDIKLADQGVVAAKYVSAGEQLTAADAPTQPVAYASLCPNAAAAPSGQVRVAVVIDYGTAVSGATPPANSVNCVTVAEPATASTALNTAATVGASDAGFINTINGYPAASSDSNAVTQPSNHGLKTLWTAIAVGLFALFIIAAVVLVRRKSKADSV